MADQSIERTVKNPKLTLIAFQLRNNLALGDEPIETANHLWEKCQELGETLNSPHLKTLINRLEQDQGKIGFPPGEDDLPNDYVELLKPKARVLDFYAIPELNKPQLKGEVYPLQIHDTYAIDITFFCRPEEVVNLSELNDFLNPNYCLLPANIKSDLGQTLILFAEPLLSESDHYQDFANACIKELFPSSDAERWLKNTPSKGEFFGSPIFEYDTGEYNPSRQIHLLIWFNCSPRTQMLEEQGNYYELLINLLCCRHKILYSYTQARWCYQQAKDLYKQLLPKVENLKKLSPNQTEKLEFLKQELILIPQSFFEYGEYIQQMKLQLNTIKTNLKNYQDYLNKLNNILIPEDNLPFLNKFETRTKNKFIEQIKVDLGYLIPGQNLFSELINTIRGLVEIEQAEIDRSLEKTIAILGVSLGVGGIAASTFSGYVERPLINSNQSPSKTSINPGLFAFLLSGTIALCTGVLTAKYLRCRRRKSPKN
ncbi:hypothetical protein [Planktothrix paucivesiculata]|uniref:Uncharacterized protein n=1 Tax=Planktothrix paucivesiculata PCC 9631 TaxID=671071 RepID=A0A7Z9E2A8_9CYAN|nr:hypothetical protein [Planktothrix paucivesiculata]VXD19674.1 conserved hypothetical protein [Planktothrix paucivesiculata PCC 9631]